MGLKSRRCGRRPRVIAVACCGLLAATVVCVPFAPGPAALARPAFATPGPNPLARAPAFLRAFGQQALAGPDGVAADPAGNVWVSDTGHDRIVEFSPSGRLVGVSGRGLEAPAGIATDAAGHVWVADTGHDRLVEFSSAGRVLTTFGAPGSGRGQLNQPAALAVTPFGDVWVADQGNSRVEEFSADGRYRTSFAVPTPAGVALDTRGDVWVASPGYAPGNAVGEFSPAGHRIRSFGVTQAGYGDLGEPGGIAIGPGGRVYVAQPDYGLVSVFSPAGRFYTEFGLQPGAALASEDLEFPEGLGVTADGRIWVADSGHDRVVQFGRIPGVPVTGAPAAPSRPLIIGECLLALFIIGLGWYLTRRRQPTPGAPPGPPGPAGPARASARAGLTRRRLLADATVLSGVAVGATALPASLRRALAVTLEDPPRGSLRDIEHIVILVQENRSFDHYFGTMTTCPRRSRRPERRMNTSAATRSGWASGSRPSWCRPGRRAAGSARTCSTTRR